MDQRDGSNADQWPRAGRAARWPSNAAAGRAGGGAGGYEAGEGLRSIMLLQQIPFGGWGPPPAAERTHNQFFSGGDSGLGWTPTFSDEGASWRHPPPPRGRSIHTRATGGEIEKGTSRRPPLPPESRSSSPELRFFFSLNRVPFGGKRRVVRVFSPLATNLPRSPSPPHHPPCANPRPRPTGARRGRCRCVAFPHARTHPFRGGRARTAQAGGGDLLACQPRRPAANTTTSTRPPTHTARWCPPNRGHHPWLGGCQHPWRRTHHHAPRSGGGRDPFLLRPRHPSSPSRLLRQVLYLIFFSPPVARACRRGAAPTPPHRVQ